MSETSSVTMPQSVNNQSECTCCSNSCSSHGSAGGGGVAVAPSSSTNGSIGDFGTVPDCDPSTAALTCGHHSSVKDHGDGGKLRLPKIRTPNNNLILPAMIARSDPKLFRDDVDIKFSRTLNSCKVPQIRHASVDRLLDRLTDLRFLSIDFLNTFLLTYRVFTTGETVLDALTRVYRNPEYGNLDSSLSLTGGTQEIMYRHSFDTSAMMSSLSEENPPSSGRPGHVEFSNTPPQHAKHLIKPQAEKPRRISTGCMKIEVTGEKTQIEGKTHSSFQKYERQDSSGQSSSSSNEELQMTSLLIPPKPKLAPIASCETLSETSEFLEDSSDSGSESLCSQDDSTSTSSITVTGGRSISETSSPTKITLNTFPCGESSTDDSLSLAVYAENNTLTVPGSLVLGGCSSETLISSPSSCQTLSTATSSDTLVPVSPRSSPLSVPSSSPKHSSISSLRLALRGKKITAPPIKIPSSNQLDALALSPATSPKFRKMPSPFRRATSPCSTAELGRAPSPVLPQRSTPSPVLSTFSPKQKQAPSPISYSFSSPNIITNLKLRAGKRGSAESDVTTLSSHSPRSSFATVTEGSPPLAKVGTVVTSSRASKRRMSSSAATAAFAAATAGSANPKDQPKSVSKLHGSGASNLKVNNLNKKRESVISTAATMRVLSVLRHWVAKHSQDFEENHELKARVKDLLEEMVCNTNLLPAEHKAAASILRVLTKEEESKTVDLNVLLQPPPQPTKDTFDTLSALDIAEQLTYLDHQIFMAIRSEELLSQAWMKPDKAERAPHVLLVSKRFNEVSRLVVSEIISRQNLQDRVSCIEKWAAIADICRCMHNYNGVLQICAAFVNSSVYRLKKTWEKISKQTKAMIEKLQTLVSSDGRFKNMRDALHRCDPPCIPYLGMYLTDLSFIEEGTPNVTEDSLVNFSKMRMIAHVIREIQLFQQTPYRIEHHRRVTNYLLDTSRLLDDDETYRASLEIEPRQPRVSVSGQSTA